MQTSGALQADGHDGQCRIGCWKSTTAIAFYFCVLVFGLSCLVWSLPAALLYRLLPRRWGEPLGQFGIMAGFRWSLFVMRRHRRAADRLSALDRLRVQTGW